LWFSILTSLRCFQTRRHRIEHCAPYWMSYHLAERGGGAPNSRLDRTGQRRPVSLSVRPSGMLGDDLKVVAIADGVAFFARDWTLARPVDLALLQSTG
jgi:hypothetical protein